MLNQDFRKFIQSLNDNHARYLVVGGYAVAFHGHPRYTKDIDIWIEMSAENASNVVAALEQFGFGSLGLREDDFLTPDQVIQLGHPPSRIDLLCTVSGVSFGDCYESRVTVEIDGVPINFTEITQQEVSSLSAVDVQEWADEITLA